MSLTWIEINQDNLYHNLAQFKKIAPKSEIWPVVKSNAYGHGLQEIVKLLDKDQNATGFMVVNLAEALEVKQISQKPVMVLSYFAREEESLKLASQHKISLPVYDLDTIDYLDSLGEKFLINIKIDTGTSRLGFSAEEAIEAIGYVKTKTNLIINSIFTHYAESEAIDQSFTKEQLNIIESVSRKYPNIKVHSACSASAIGLPETQQDIIRAGIALYGLWPSQVIEEKGQILKMDLKPVLSFKTRIIQIKKLQAGQSVGYDRTYVCEKDCCLGVIPVGYNEGYNRLFSNRAEVLVNGQRHRVRGNVCMNLTMIELSCETGVEVGDVVTLIGQDIQENIRVEELAELAQTINYEVVTKINSKLPRLVI